MADVTSPSFTAPPLDEVILGIQFVPDSGFNSTFHSSIHNLFQQDFPRVEEHQPLPPQIEAFGGNPVPGFQINFGDMPPKSRLWFVSEDNSHLVQFQDDRLIFNWQNRSPSNPYPRHTRMAEDFQSYISRLNSFYRNTFGYPLSITQAEVAYVNIIPLNDTSEAGKWLRLIDTLDLDFEGINFLASRVLHHDNMSPIARIFYEIQTVFHQHSGQPALRFTLTCRGKPSGEAIADAIKFTTFARDRIVNDFCKLTTEEAHAHWGRQI